MPNKKERVSVRDHALEHVRSSSLRDVISRAEGPTILCAAQTGKDSDLICKDSRFRLTVNSNFC